MKLMTSCKEYRYICWAEKRVRENMKHGPYVVHVEHVKCAFQFQAAAHDNADGSICMRHFHIK